MAPFLEKLLPYVIFSILALAGVATAIGDTSAGIFITILVLALLGAARIVTPALIGIIKILFQHCAPVSH